MQLAVTVIGAMIIQIPIPVPAKILTVMLENVHVVVEVCAEDVAAQTVVDVSFIAHFSFSFSKFYENFQFRERKRVT